MLIEKAIKVKIYPNEEQIQLFNKTVGCKRFVYNYFLGMSSTGYKSYNLNSKELTSLKTINVFLKEVDKFALQNSLKDLNDSFKRFFKKQNQYPKFKNKKREIKSYRTNFTNNNIEITPTFIKLPKLGKVKLKEKIKLKNIVKINSVTIKQVNNSYYVSIQCLYDYKSTMDKPINDIIGIDLGIKEYLVTSKGDIVHNPRYLKQYQDKLSKLQRKAAKCKKGSNNQVNLYKQIGKLQTHIANSRKDFQHKVSTKLINENQVIVVETLKVNNMIKNHKLAKHIQDCAWSQFISFLEYKAIWNNRTIIKVPTKFPSSQRCSCCGYINPDVKNLKVREWGCPNCKNIHNRDLNAAINLELYGSGLI